MALKTVEKIDFGERYLQWDEGDLDVSLSKEIISTLGDLSDRMATRSDIEKLREDVCDLKAQKGILEAKAEAIESHLADQDGTIGELEKRLRSIEQWRWKIIGGMLVLATVGSSFGSALTSLILAK
jgi:hypothetical protein